MLSETEKKQVPIFRWSHSIILPMETRTCLRNILPMLFVDLRLGKKHVAGEVSPPITDHSAPSESHGERMARSSLKKVRIEFFCFNLRRVTVALWI